MERSIREIYEHADEIIESLWDNEKVPAQELEILIFALMHLNDVDIESITTIFDSIAKKYKKLEQLEVGMDNVIPFPVKR